MSKSELLQIKPAEYSDIEQVIAVCSENLVSVNREKFSDEDFSKRGFLIRKMTPEEAKEMIDDQENHFLHVAKNGDEILGYLSGCDLKKTPLDLQEKVFKAQELQDYIAKNGEKVFYHKQIAKRVNAKNVGKKLLFSMFAEAKNRGYGYVVCRIVYQPFYNEISIAFHEKFGFKKIGEMEDNGAQLGVYLKDLR